MWRSLVVVASIGSGALADRKEAPPDTPTFADATSITLELAANAGAPRCQKLDYSIRLDLTSWRWVRSRVTCSDRAGAVVPKTVRESGVVAKSQRAT
ncbi:MAG: hypothetical protein ABI175_23785, partial [Polyangiales bacterium]